MLGVPRFSWFFPFNPANDLCLEDPFSRTSACVLNGKIYNAVFLFSNLPTNTIQPQPGPDILKVIKTAPLKENDGRVLVVLL